jgi:hypothetical protein
VQQIIKAIADAGVNVVVSGGTISDMALHFLERYKIMAVKTPSKFQLRRICKAVQATPIVKIVCSSLYLLVSILFLSNPLPLTNINNTGSSHARGVRTLRCRDSGGDRKHTGDHFPPEQGRVCRCDPRRARQH